MFEESDQQFANAAKHEAVRRHLLLGLQNKRRHCRLSIIVLSGVSVLQLLGVLLMARFSSSWEVLDLSCLGLLCLIAGVVSETGRFYALDTQIKVMRMFEVAHGQAEAEPLLESFSPLL